jgi:soluble lytic murein transglycosylase-like protein
MKRLHHLIGRAALLAGIPGYIACMAPQVYAAEYAVLANGFRLHADRHEAEGGIVRLFSGAGVVEMPIGAIVAFEPEEAVQPETVPEIAPPAVAASLPEVTAPPASPADLAVLAAKKNSLPGSFVRSVMKAESGFQPAALSPKGAIGLMQLMPETARALGVDPRDPYQNANGGAQYLRTLLAKYEDDPNQVLLALAAYNAGPAAVDRYHGVPPFRETREYILRVLKEWDRSGNK